jgi:hypothetical protein
LSRRFSSAARARSPTLPQTPSGCGKPGQAPDPCHESLETTVYDSLTSTHVENPPIAKRPKIDCFYVYPTVSGQAGPKADLGIDPELTSIAQYQAARFSQRCRVFAPVYPQLTLSTIGARP